MDKPNMYEVRVAMSPRLMQMVRDKAVADGLTDGDEDDASLLRSLLAQLLMTMVDGVQAFDVGSTTPDSN